MLKIESKKQGAELTSIIFQEKEKLHDAKTAWQRHAPILFPIVGQLRNGETKIEGKTYQMSQHGFARDLEFKELEKTNIKHQYVLEASQETKKKYPYKFALYVTYQVENNTLIVQYQVVNKEEKVISFGLGGHPAFCCDYSNGEYEIEFEKQEENIEFLTLENGLISHKKGTNILKNNKIELKENTFENDAIIMKNLASHQVSLKNKKEKRKILEFDFTGFPYLALWSKKGAPFVCIEPWLNTADKIDSNGIFEEKENIIQLQPKDIFTCQYKIKFIKEEKENETK